MNKNPIVSVIIPAYNVSKYLPDSLESVLEQTYHNFECLVVDDGSTDDTEQIVIKYAKSDRRVRYYKKENGGAASARNYGVVNAKGELIQFLDADDWLNTEKLEYQINFINDHNIRDDKFVIYSDFEIVWYGKENEIDKLKIHRFGALDKDTLKKMIIGRKFGLDTPTPLSVCSTLFSNSVVREFKFNENMVSYEDLEYFIRILVSDTNFYYTPIVGFSYRQRNDSLSKNKIASRIGYLQFLESVHELSKKDLVYCPNMFHIINHFFGQRNKEMFNRAIKLIKKTDIPVHTPADKNIRKSIVSLDSIKMYYPYLLLNHYEKQIIKRLKRIRGKGKSYNSDMYTAYD